MTTKSNTNSSDTTALKALAAKIKESAIQIDGKGLFREVKLVNAGTWKEGEQPTSDWKPWNIGWTVVELETVLKLITDSSTKAQKP
jgi:hypothetical protein